MYLPYGYKYRNFSSCPNPPYFAPSFARAVKLFSFEKDFSQLIYFDALLSQNVLRRVPDSLIHQRSVLKRSTFNVYLFFVCHTELRGDVDSLWIRRDFG